MDGIFDERLKKKKKLAPTNDLNTVEKIAMKNDEKMEKSQSFDLRFLLVKVNLVMMDHKIYQYFNQLTKLLQCQLVLQIQLLNGSLKRSQTKK